MYDIYGCDAKRDFARWRSIFSVQCTRKQSNIDQCQLLVVYKLCKIFIKDISIV